MIEGRGIHLALKEKPVLKGLSFQIEAGRVTAFIGKSGAGKTSLLKCLGGLVEYEGELQVEGKDLQALTVRERIASIGFVFQQYHLFPHMTVLENVFHPLCTVLKMPREEAERRAKEVLGWLGLGEFLFAYPSELSGGQQQRAAIARALALRPKVLLFDEPSAALDPENTDNFISIVKDLLKEGIAVVLSSHDRALLQGLLDRVYFMEEGQIVEMHEGVIGEKSKTREFIYEKTGDARL